MGPAANRCLLARRRDGGPPGARRATLAQDTQIKAAHSASRPVRHGIVNLGARLSSSRPPRLGRSLRSRRMRSASPTLDPESTHQGLAAIEDDGAEQEHEDGHLCQKVGVLTLNCAVAPDTLTPIPRLLRPTTRTDLDALNTGASLSLNLRVQAADRRLQSRQALARTGI
jgi:hypothetical protein